MDLAALVDELVELKRTGFLETIERGHPVVGDVSARPIGDSVELRFGSTTQTIAMTALRDAIDARAGTPRLFGAVPTSPRPGPAEDELLRELEQQVVALDALEAAGDEAATSAKRRFVLDDLEYYGILALRGNEARAFWLERWNLPGVLAFQRAALAAWTYYLGSQRADALKSPAPAVLVDGPFSLDWFRRPPAVPAAWTADRLAILGETTFKRMFENPDRAVGTYFYSSGRIRGQFWFRTDVTKVCLYKANVTVG